MALKKSGSSKSGDQTDATAAPNFTVDGEKTGRTLMPSVTRLLDRKVLKTTSDSPVQESPTRGGLSFPLQAPKGPPGPPPGAPAKSSLPPSQRPGGGSPVRPAQIRWNPKEGAALQVQSPAEISQRADPLGQALKICLQKGGQSAVFLASSAPFSTQNEPALQATLAVGDASKVALWQGLQWVPGGAPGLWAAITRTGSLELPPGNPSTTPAAALERNAARSAFGASETGWLVFIQAGPPNACQGLIVLHSKASLLSVVPTVTQLMRAPAAKKAA